MRNEEDILRLRFQLEADIELDRERMVEDPNWAQVSSRFDLSDPSDFILAVTAYIRHYVTRERLLSRMPCTNGPGDARLLSMEVVDGKHGASADRG